MQVITRCTLLRQAALPLQRAVQALRQHRLPARVLQAALLQVKLQLLLRTRGILQFDQ